MILRRSKANVADYQLQFRSFAGIDPDVIDVIRTDWVSGDASRVDFRSVGELDFKALFAALAEKGYLSKSFRPEPPTAAEMDALLAEFAGRRGGGMRPLRQGERHADEEAAA